MSTEYTLQMNRCEHCGRHDEIVIGTSAMGWVFGLHIYPSRGINSLDDWKKLWRNGKTLIFDECGRGITPEEMEDRIENRISAAPPEGENWYHVNQAEPGPNNLARAIARPDVRRGENNGTFDYYICDTPSPAEQTEKE